MASVLWIIAVILVIAGVVSLVQGEVVLGIALIVIGLLVGPGGVSVFTSHPSQPSQPSDREADREVAVMDDAVHSVAVV